MVSKLPPFHNYSTPRRNTPVLPSTTRHYAKQRRARLLQLHPPKPRSTCKTRTLPVQRLSLDRGRSCGYGLTWMGAWRIPVAAFTSTHLVFRVEDFVAAHAGAGD